MIFMRLRSKEEGTSSRSLIGIRKTNTKEEGVEKKLEKLKEELLVELNSKVGTQTGLGTSSIFSARI